MLVDEAAEGTGVGYFVACAGGRRTGGVRISARGASVDDPQGGTNRRRRGGVLLSKAPQHHGDHGG